MPQPPLQDIILRKHVAKATVAALLILLTAWFWLSR